MSWKKKFKCSRKGRKRVLVESVEKHNNYTITYQKITMVWINNIKMS